MSDSSHHRRPYPLNSIERLESRIAPAAVLVLTSTPDTDVHVIRGQFITYTLSVTNSGDSFATNVDLSMTLQQDRAERPFDFGDGFQDADGDGTYHNVLKGLAPGATATATFTLEVGEDISTAYKTLTTVANVTFQQGENPQPPQVPAAIVAADSDTQVTSTLPIYQGIYVVSSGVAKRGDLGTSDLRVFDIATNTEFLDFRAYPDVNGKVIRDSFRVALGDFNNDGFDDIVVSTAYGSGPIKVFNGETGEMMTQIAPFNGKKGLFVAAGDVDGDGFDDIVVGSALGGGALSAIDGRSFKYIGTPVYPFGKGFKGGVRVAVADFDGVEGNFDRFNNFSNEIVAAEGNFGNKISILSLDNSNNYVQRGLITVGGATYRGGINVSAGDLDGDGQNEIIAARNRLSGPIVDIFTVDLADNQNSSESLLHGTEGGSPGKIQVLNDLVSSLNQSFTPFPEQFRQGVRVAVGDVDGDGSVDILCMVGYSGGSLVKLASGSLDDGFSINPEFAFTAFERPLPALWAAISHPIPIPQQTKG